MADVRDNRDVDRRGREDPHPCDVQGPVEVGRGPEHTEVDRLGDRRLRPDRAVRRGQGSGWVLTQPITASSTNSATAYAVSRHPRRDGAAASFSGVTDAMAGG